MPLFQLVLQTSPDLAPETLQFIAGDVPNALTFANRHTSEFPAELWCDGRRVCRIQFERRTRSWVVVDPPDDPAERRG